MLYNPVFRKKDPSSSDFSYEQPVAVSLMIRCDVELAHVKISNYTDQETISIIV